MKEGREGEKEKRKGGIREKGERRDERKGEKEGRNDGGMRIGRER